MLTRDIDDGDDSDDERDCLHRSHPQLSPFIHVQEVHRFRLCLEGRAAFYPQAKLGFLNYRLAMDAFRVRAAGRKFSITQTSVLISPAANASREPSGCTAIP